MFFSFSGGLVSAAVGGVSQVASLLGRLVGQSFCQLWFVGQVGVWWCGGAVVRTVVVVVVLDPTSLL